MMVPGRWRSTATPLVRILRIVSDRHLGVLTQTRSIDHLKTSSGIIPGHINEVEPTSGNRSDIGPSARGDVVLEHSTLWECDNLRCRPNRDPYAPLTIVPSYGPEGGADNG